MELKKFLEEVVKRKPDITKAQLQSVALVWKQRRKSEIDKKKMIFEQVQRENNIIMNTVSTPKNVINPNLNQNLVLNNNIGVIKNNNEIISANQASILAGGSNLNRPSLTSDPSVLTSIYRSGLSANLYDNQNVNLQNDIKRQFFN